MDGTVCANQLLVESFDRAVGTGTVWQYEMMGDTETFHNESDDLILEMSLLIGHGIVGNAENCTPVDDGSGGIDCRCVGEK